MLISSADQVQALLHGWLARMRTGWGLPGPGGMNWGDRWTGVGGVIATSLQSFIRANNDRSTAVMVTLKPDCKYFLRVCRNFNSEGTIIIQFANQNLYCIDSWKSHFSSNVSFQFVTHSVLKMLKKDNSATYSRFRFTRV